MTIIAQIFAWCEADGTQTVRWGTVYPCGGDCPGMCPLLLKSNLHPCCRQHQQRVRLAAVAYPLRRGITHYTLHYRPSNGCAAQWLRSAIAGNRFRSSGAAEPHAKLCAKGTLSPLDPLPRNRRFLWILPAKGSAAPFGFPGQRKAATLLWYPPKKQNRMCLLISTFRSAFTEKRKRNRPVLCFFKNLLKKQTTR